MKYSILTIVSVFSLAFVSINSFTMQKQLAFCDSELNGIRSIHVYPWLTLKSLTKLACSNKQLLQEMNEMCLKSNCDKLTKAIVDAWGCFAEGGCYPQIKICTWDILCFSNKKMQDTFAIDCVESIIKPGIWRKNRCLIGTDKEVYSLSTDNNQIVFKSTGCNSQNICIDDNDNDKKKTGLENRTMSIYSIDREADLHENEFNNLVNKDIEIPLILLIDSLILKNPKNMGFLLEKFKMLNLENQNIVDTCITDLQLIDQLYSMTKNLEIDAIIAHWQNPQDYALPLIID